MKPKLKNNKIDFLLTLVKCLKENEKMYVANKTKKYMLKSCRALEEKSRDVGEKENITVAINTIFNEKNFLKSK
jgi:hypothetical protein